MVSRPAATWSWDSGWVPLSATGIFMTSNREWWRAIGKCTEEQAEGCVCTPGGEVDLGHGYHWA